ncbi:MAG: hypothetical protein ACI86M_001020 [Saprospiraceae bacterium]|jgi:hypothetical protein
MKRILIPFLILVFMFSLVDDASAQRRGKKKRRKKENTEETDERRNSRDEDDEDYGPSGIKEKLNTEIKLGNLNFFSNVFNLSMKSNVGYKLNKTFSAGLGAKFDYYYISSPGPGDISDLSYGGLVYSRAKITQQLYAQVEYNAFRALPRTTLSPKKTFLYPSVGLGYMYEGFNWSSGIEVLVPLSDEVRDEFNIVEYWISFSHNF